MSGSVSGSSCEVTITLQNLKNFWTNFTISPVGSVAVTPLGGDQNVYAKFGLCRLQVFFPSHRGISVSFVLRFTKPGEAVSVFSNPTIDTGYRSGCNEHRQAYHRVGRSGQFPVLV